MKYWILLHLLGVVVWVGGMFFAYVALRPVAAQLLEPPQRLPLWAGVFQKFFPWVWLSVVLILLSGLMMIANRGGFAGLPVTVHVMFTIGLVMTAVFVYVFFIPFARLRRFAAAQEWKSAGAALAVIRQLVGFNLILGLLNIVVAIMGRAI